MGKVDTCLEHFSSLSPSQQPLFVLRYVGRYIGSIGLEKQTVDNLTKDTLRVSTLAWHLKNVNVLEVEAKLLIESIRI